MGWCIVRLVGIRGGFGSPVYADTPGYDALPADADAAIHDAHADAGADAGADAHADAGADAGADAHADDEHAINAINANADDARHAEAAHAEPTNDVHDGSRS